ncbi:hypothetical protein DENSPDRAFT_908736 [Dentipellis sp. KUC8613]|nr:hypothetical protein DENSPDRAFT_908736 [Dentipellis sp. KUC8613]
MFRRSEGRGFRPIGGGGSKRGGVPGRGVCGRGRGPDASGSLEKRGAGRGAEEEAVEEFRNKAGGIGRRGLEGVGVDGGLSRSILDWSLIGEGEKSRGPWESRALTTSWCNGKEEKEEAENKEREEEGGVERRRLESW